MTAPKSMFCSEERRTLIEGKERKNVK